MIAQLVKFASQGKLDYFRQAYKLSWVDQDDLSIDCS